MSEIEQSKLVEIRTHPELGVQVFVDGHCHLRVNKVATLQLNMQPDQYVSKTKDGTFVTRRHKTGTACWCGKNHFCDQVKRAMKGPIIHSGR